MLQTTFRQYADLEDVMFKGADLLGTKLLDANLSKANLKGADL